MPITGFQLIRFKLIGKPEGTYDLISDAWGVSSFQLIRFKLIGKQLD